MFRILITPAIFDTRETAQEAQALAMREARALSLACGFSLECRVYRTGVPTRDDFGRDLTPSYLVGRAIGAAEGVEWRVPAPLVRRVA